MHVREKVAFASHTHVVHDSKSTYSVQSCSRHALHAAQLPKGLTNMTSVARVSLLCMLYTTLHPFTEIYDAKLGFQNSLTSSCVCRHHSDLMQK